MRYQLLPFRFERFDEERYLITNDVGEYIFLQNDDFALFVNSELDPHSELFYDIESKLIELRMWSRCWRQSSGQRKAFLGISHRCIWWCQPCDVIQVVSIAKLLEKILKMIRQI